GCPHRSRCVWGTYLLIVGGGCSIFKLRIPIPGSCRIVGTADRSSRVWPQDECHKKLRDECPGDVLRQAHTMLDDRSPARTEHVRTPARAGENMHAVRKSRNDSPPPNAASALAPDRARTDLAGLRVRGW